MDDACVLFRNTFVYETETDHVEEIHFEHPVYLTAFQVDFPNGVQCRIRFYARDVLCLSGSRLVPLFDGIPQSSTNRLQIPKTVSDRVVLRAEAVEFRLLIFGRNYVHPVKTVQLQSASFDPSKPTGKDRKITSMMMTPYQTLSNSPYLHGFPQELTALLSRLGREGDCSSKETQGLVFQTADELCRGLGILSSQDQDRGRMDEELVSLPDSMELAALAKKVVKWMESMSLTNNGGNNSRDSGTINEGMLSLGLTVLFCSCRSTVLHFISAGGLSSLIGIFQLRGATALMMRYLVCSVELISIVGGVIGCSSLLGTWKYPSSAAADSSSLLKPMSSMIHVPGIIDVKLKREEISSPSLPPGMIRSRKSLGETEVENQRTKLDEISKRKASSSSRSKKEKRRKSKHKTSEKSVHGNAASRHHHNESKKEDREMKRHRHRRSISEQKQTNEDCNKRQKLGHPISSMGGGGTSCIDLELHDGLIKTQSLYEILFDIVFQPRPKGIIDSVKRALDRLNLFHCLSEIQVASNKLAKLVVSDDEKELELMFIKLKPVLSCVDPCLVQIFNFMKSSIQKMNIDNNNNNNKDDNQNNKGLWSVKELDESFLELLSGMESIMDLDLIIKILHLPCNFIETTETNNEDDKEQFQRLKASILHTTGALLSLILLCPNGLPFLKHQKNQIASMEQTGRHMSHPGDNLTTVQVKKDFQSRLAFLLKTIECHGVLELVSEGELESPQQVTSALKWISEFLKTNTNDDEALSLALNAAPQFLTKLSQIMDHQTQQLMVLNNEEVDTESTDQSMHLTRRIPVHLAPAFELLSELSCLCWSPGVLMGFLQCTDQLQRSVEKEQELTKRILVSHQDHQLQTRHLLSQLEICRSYSKTGWSGILSDLDSIFSQLSAQEDSIGLFKDEGEFGRVIMSLKVLICVMNSSPNASTVCSLYGSNLLPTLEKALKTAIVVMKAGNADFLASAMTGEFKNDLATLLSASRALECSKIDIKSTGCIESLIEAYYILSLTSESMLSILDKTLEDSEVLKCKSEISEILLIWMEANWTPSVLDLVFAPTHTVNGSFSKPSRIFSNCCLLSDLFQEEWPPLPYITQQRGFIPPPPKMKTRALLARGLEYHNRAFKYLIEYGLGSESHIVRCMVVKLCSRAAGLGGGMGVFLVEPIMKELTLLIKNNGTPSDYYRLVEIVTGLVHWPAIKAAFLDFKLVSSVSRLLHSLAPECEKEGSLLIICSAFLDVFQSLMDPEIALDVYESRELRLQLDCPGPSELGVMVAALLANLNHFQSLETKVLELLKSIEALTDGRSILLRGISRWRTAYTSTTNELTKPQSSSVKILEFLSSLTEAPSVSGKDMVGSLERPPAPERFKELVQKTQERKDWLPPPPWSQSRREESGQLYWKFIHQFPALQLRKKWKKWDCNESTSAPPTEFFGSGFLTTSSRSRETQNQQFTQQIRDSVETVSNVSEKAGSDLPPVLALPRRSQESRKTKSVTGTSRLPSIHVDEYHNKSPVGASENTPSSETKGQTPRIVSRGLSQLSLQSTPKQASELVVPQPSTPLSKGQSKEERATMDISSLVAIPGLGSTSTGMIIPGLGPDSGSSAKLRKTSVDTGPSGLPLAPPLLADSGEEELRGESTNRLLNDSMLVDQTD
eukprot:g3293.t1